MVRVTCKIQLVEINNIVFTEAKCNSHDWLVHMIHEQPKLDASVASNVATALMHLITYYLKKVLLMT